ncbi:MULTISPECIES: hypothetical protein [unclassified Polaribacter]|uniref:hypothetical protein n=1 Tax=unclassified Polaribacter TaxID=196858 RepID=UPI0011BF3B47|nr:MULTISPECIES: hypothetical protein [unclassified Polaribacter]TXD51535.1 hypothetical protein ES043_11690 [Polaribacter sp. IC063]TXD56221.1 hypothetical protein ES044_17230 [Polaribacter sp. IC066]
MKTVFRNSVFATAFILTSSLFINCDQTTTIKENKMATIAVESSLDYTVKQEVITRNPLVFITGFDKGEEHYYETARSFFEEKEFEIVEDQYSIEEIINWLNRNVSENPYGEIHIVNKSNPFKGMSLETVVKGEKVTAQTLRKNITMGTLPILQESVNANSKIIFHANGLGENKELMKAFKDAFCADELPNVIASPYYSIFNGEFSNHYLAKPHYVFYPTAHSPGKVDLSKEIARKYPQEKDINWYDTLNNEYERFVGEAYTTQFEIPIKFELDYHNSDNEVPTFENQEEIINFIEQQELLFAEVEELNIPIAKYRWTYRMKNSTLIITGKSTGLVVLKPLIKPYGELQYIQPDTNNKRLYALK